MLVSAERALNKAHIRDTQSLSTLCNVHEPEQRHLNSYGCSTIDSNRVVNMNKRWRRSNYRAARNTYACGFPTIYIHSLLLRPPLLANKKTTTTNAQLWSNLACSAFLLSSIRFSLASFYFLSTFSLVLFLPSLSSFFAVYFVIRYLPNYTN